MEYYGLTHDLLNSVISNDLEWLSKIFNETKRRVVSLRQLSFLFYDFGVIDNTIVTNNSVCYLPLA